MPASFEAEYTSPFLTLPDAMAASVARFRFRTPSATANLFTIFLSPMSNILASESCLLRDPSLLALSVFLLPDGCRLLQLIYDELTCCEGVLSVRRANSNHDNDVTDPESSNSVGNSKLCYIEHVHYAPADPPEIR